MAVPPEWVKSALTVTGRFEDASDPFGAVSGDFDGMGISLGVLQWNLGSATLQPLVLAMGQQQVCAAMPRHGPAFWQAVKGDRAAALRTARSWQNRARLDRAVLAELKALARSPACVAQQVAAAQAMAERA